MPAWTLAILGSWIQEGREGFPEVTGLWSLSVIVPVLAVYRIMIRLQNSPGPIPCQRTLAVSGPVRVFKWATESVQVILLDAVWETKDEPRDMSVTSPRRGSSHSTQPMTRHAHKVDLWGYFISAWDPHLLGTTLRAQMHEHKCFAWVLRNSQKQAFKETVQMKELWLGKAFWATSCQSENRITGPPPPKHVCPQQATSIKGSYY